MCRLTNTASGLNDPFTGTPGRKVESWYYHGQVRLSVGIEDVEDIIADLDQALKKLKERLCKSAID